MNLVKVCLTPSLLNFTVVIEDFKFESFESIIWNLLRLNLWLSTKSIFKNVPWPFKRNVHSAIVVCIVEYKSIRSNLLCYSEFLYLCWCIFLSSSLSDSIKKNSHYSCESAYFFFVPHQFSLYIFWGHNFSAHKLHTHHEIFLYLKWWPCNKIYFTYY